MQVKRFLAADMRRALEMVRQELGSDAVILSSNRTKDGVELLTTKASPPVPEAPAERASAPQAEMSEAPQTGAERAAAIERAQERRLEREKVEASAREYLQPNQRVNAGIPAGRDLGRQLAEGSDGAVDGARFMSAAQRYPLHEEPGYAPAEKRSRGAVASARHSEPRATDRPAQDSQDAQPQPQLQELQAELAEMRLLLEEQLSQVMTARGETPRPPALASVGRRLGRMGLPQFAMDSVLEGVVENRPLAQGWSDALARLSRQLPVNGTDLVDAGGVFALVGPTGAGKTTTIGKLAARYVMAHGARDVALVTLDTHRIGGHDQLRSLARILGVTLKVVDDSQSLDSVLYSLRRCGLVLIDTAGFRQGDPRLNQQMQTLSDQSGVKNLLVLPCNSQEAMLKASAHAYGGVGLEGAVLTKLDETGSLGEALGVVMQSKVPIVYTTHGQDIPRDLEVARSHQLVAKAAAMLNRKQGDRARHGAADSGQRPQFRAV